MRHGSSNTTAVPGAVSPASPAGTVTRTGAPPPAAPTVPGVPAVVSSVLIPRPLVSSSSSWS
ncbi:hypothetical protein CXF34_08350 [Corynebacterium bovis]|nr:hypothetical protein CXF31_08770 [Corynebacterium bovis]RRQ07918.1 hypothetical protein CXF34_08350 [Corynebacterium bovis]